MMRAAHRIVLIAAVLEAIGAVNGQALTGLVRSADEGPMEGVLVSAQRVNTPITITVVTDATGRYTFPRNRLDPGRYTLHVRATGYDLEDPASIDIASNKTASADLKLAKTKDLASQLSNAEWLLSMPGPDDQKSFLLNCVNCHRLDFITRSRHTSAEFIQVMERMSTYANQSTPLKPQRRKAEHLLEDRGESRRLARERQATYMSEVNLSKSNLSTARQSRLPGITPSRLCPAPKATVRRSSSPNTICRAKPSSLMTSSSIPPASSGTRTSASRRSESSIRKPAS